MRDLIKLMKQLKLIDIEAAKNRIDKYINQTPILTSQVLNDILGHEIYFKAEGFQKIGAFKIRGGINTVAWLIENKFLCRNLRWSLLSARGSE